MINWTDNKLSTQEILVLGGVQELQNNIAEFQYGVPGYVVHEHIWPIHTIELVKVLNKLTQDGYLLREEPKSLVGKNFAMFCIYRVAPESPEPFKPDSGLIETASTALAGGLGVLAACYWAAWLLGEHPGRTTEQVVSVGGLLSIGSLMSWGVCLISRKRKNKRNSS